jgi:hypothetical protein
MAGYHVFLVNGRGGIVGRRDVDCASDRTAVEAARAILAADAPQYLAAEIWRGTRKVLRIDHAAEPPKVAVGN